MSKDTGSTPNATALELPERLYAAAAAIEHLSATLGNTKDCAYGPSSIRKQANRLIQRRGRPE